MITVCSNCSSRIQIEDDKLGTGRTLRCPKCKHEISTAPASPASEKSALAVGNSPATEGRRPELPSPAPLFEAESRTANGGSVADGDKLAQLIAALLAQNDNKLIGDPSDRPSWDKRKVLVCTPEEVRSKIARLLTDEGYKVFVANDTKQAVERMRENQLDIVLLEPQFDAGDQGAAFVVREVNVLRPSQRRRLFFVLLSPSLRTMDAHAAFLNNVNAVVHIKDLDELVRVLSHGLRDFNELYKDFNAALRLTPI